MKTRFSYNFTAFSPGLSSGHMGKNPYDQQLPLSIGNGATQNTTRHYSLQIKFGFSIPHITTWFPSIGS